MAQYRIPSGVHVREFEGELVILDMKAGSYFGVNEVGARIFSMLQAGAELSAAIDACAPEYDVDKATLTADVEELVAELTKQGLLEPVR